MDVDLDAYLFCKRAVKSACALMNHLEKQYLKLQHLRKQTNTSKEDLDRTKKATDAA